MIMHDDAYYASRVPIKDLGPFKNFLRFVWDNERRAFLDRTAKDWGLLGVFYLCFFGVLFSLFALQMWIALSYVASYDKPYMQYNGRIITKTVYEPTRRSFFHATFTGFGSPGLSFVPNVFSPTTAPIIWISDSSEKSKPEKYIGAIKSFIDGYKRNESAYDTHCSGGIFRSEYGQKPCFFNTEVLGPCSTPPYGYASPYRPCVFVKVNRRFDWVPIYYNQTSELPEKMPLALRNIIRVSNEFRVWLSCTGASNVDKDHIGDIDYHPAPGFPVEFFPFTGKKTYMSPLVGLVFKNLTVNRLVTVECTIWAHNIGQDNRYFLYFQIMINEKSVLGSQMPDNRPQ